MNTATEIERSKANAEHHFINFHRTLHSDRTCLRLAYHLRAVQRRLGTGEEQPADMDLVRDLIQAIQNRMHALMHAKTKRLDGAGAIVVRREHTVRRSRPMCQL